VASCFTRVYIHHKTARNSAGLSTVVLISSHPTEHTSGRGTSVMNVRIIITKIA